MKWHKSVNRYLYLPRPAAQTGFSIECFEKLSVVEISLPAHLTNKTVFWCFVCEQLYLSVHSRSMRLKVKECCWVGTIRWICPLDRYRTVQWRRYIGLSERHDDQRIRHFDNSFFNTWHRTQNCHRLFGQRWSCFVNEQTMTLMMRTNEKSKFLFSDKQIHNHYRATQIKLHYALCGRVYLMSMTTSCDYLPCIRRDNW